MPEALDRFLHTAKLVEEADCYPYYRAIEEVQGGIVRVDGKPMIMVGSNDYLGLRSHRKLQEAAVAALQRWGTGPGGARILCGNLTSHEELERRLARFVGKRGALVYTTGFLANIGAVQALCGDGSIFLSDQEGHASLFEGGWASRGKVVPFKHNDIESARSRLERARSKFGAKRALLVTEGVFSMSGDVAALQELVDFKNATPNVKLYLDDAHGLGVLGPGGSGTCKEFGLTSEVDYIMGTFSKSFASIGGFIASDDLDVLSYLRHQSKAMLFTAALPAVNVATVLAALDVLEEEPERRDHLFKITKRARARYEEIGLTFGGGESPIIPIAIGDEMLALRISEELYQRGVYALPALHPAVPKGKAIIRTAYSSAHTEEQVDQVAEVLLEISKLYPIANR